jgi:hypothetical protein
MAGEDVLTLSTAAREMGCHVETLRERVRDGRLQAMRGPHGAYVVTRAAIEAQEKPRRGRPPTDRDWLELTETLERKSWAEVERLLSDESDDIRIELRLIKALREDPDFWPELYNLVSVHRLRAIGGTTRWIGWQLEISERHVRRLVAKRLWRRMRYLLAIRRTRLNRALARRRARELIEILRDRLHAQRVPPSPGRWKRHKLNAYEREALLNAGVTVEELEAIWLEGLTINEINHLLLKGFGRSTRHKVTIRTKSEPLDPLARHRRSFVAHES